VVKVIKKEFQGLRMYASVSIGIQLSDYAATRT